MLEERSLRPAGWVLPFGLTAESDSFEQGLDELPATAETCARAGMDRCSIWVAPASDERTYEEMFELVRERGRRVCLVLAEHGIRLGLEFIGPATARAGRKHEFIYTMEGMLELCDAIGTGNAGLLLDSWHLYTSGGRMDDVLELSDDRIVNVHINDAPAGVPREEQIDNVRRLPGETGVIDVRRFLEGLAQIGYAGPVMAEPFSEKLKQMSAAEAVRTVKEAIDGVWPG
jgi:sugar phosphate isomerase/epimerase